MQISKQQFLEDSEIVYTLTVEVNGDTVIDGLQGYELDKLYEQSTMIETAVRDALDEQYKDIYGIPMPESEQTE